MIKLFLISFFTCTTLSVFSQDEKIIMKSFHKEDTVLLRWAPITSDLFFKGLENGYQLDRIPEGENFEANSNLYSVNILPFDKRKNIYLNSIDTSLAQLTAFVELLMEKNLSSEEKKMTYSILVLSAGSNKGIAEMLGLYYQDLDQLDGGYEYRISLNKSTYGKVTVNTSKIDRNQQISELKGLSKLKLQETYLNWEVLALEKGYSSYWIERSDDSVHFEKLNEIPYYFFQSEFEENKTHADFVDTTVLEGQKYYYRIAGINHFGEIGERSNIVPVYIQRTLHGECRIDSITAEKSDRIIKGEFISYSEMNNLSGFSLFRSDSLLHSYRLIESVQGESGDFEFNMTSELSSGDRYYYVVSAISVDGDTIKSYPYYFFTLDQIPPEIPSELEGIVNDSGVVTLNWKENAENDIRGYRIFRSNSLKEEFVEVTKRYAKENFYYDTLSLNNLTSKIYYRISAVDNNYNNSGFTEPIELKKPDTIPPVACIINKYRSLEEGFEISWINSSSKDVDRNYLIRTSEVIDTVLIWQGSLNTFKDSTAIVGDKYRYQISTIDDSKNMAWSEALSVKYETGIRQGVQDFKGEIDREEKVISLSWELPLAEIYSIQIYRAKGDGKFRLIKTIKDLQESYEDKNLSINNEYSYKVKLNYKTGHSSRLSKVVKLVY